MRPASDQTVTKPSPEASPSPVPHGTTPLRRPLLQAIGTAAAGVGCGLFIGDQAETGDGGMQTLGLVLAAFAFGLLGAFITLGVSFASPRVGAAIGLCAAALLTGWTTWETRPQAPTGQEHVETLATGVLDAESEVAEVLNEVVPGRWWVRYRGEPWPCRDDFGRSRGAARMSVELDVSPALDSSEGEHLGQVLRARGWHLEPFSHSGGQYFVGRRGGYEIRTDATTDNPEWEWSISISTPCLAIDP